MLGLTVSSWKGTPGVFQMGNKRTDFSFSEPFLETYLVEDAGDYHIEEKTIFVNLGKSSVGIAGSELKPMSSSIYSNVVVRKAEKLVCVGLNENFLPCSFPFSNELKATWQHVHEIFPLPQLKKAGLWRSKKERIGDIGFNLWFASADTDCGIHDKHDFREIHTQVYGLGRMQKFWKDDVKTQYNEVFMAPGYTHEPFYNERGAYPWHRYYADSDCVWMAIEFYDE